MWLAIPLGLLVAGFVGELARRGGTAGASDPSHTGAWPLTCPASGAAPLQPRGRLDKGPAEEDVSRTQEPLRFDCGTGEVWGRHVP